jgi:anthranilate phosphoribosyltransferase
MIKEAIQLLADRKDLSFENAQQSMHEIMDGEATATQIAAFLMALRMKGETVDEITAFAIAMKEHSVRINPHVHGRLVDTCGTGGDLVKTFNVSTTAAFISSGGGVAVAKHGNRSVTSKCGSADVLEALGLNLNVDPSIVERAIEQIGIGFMFAPVFHPAMKNAILPRREIGIRTVFNMLGPLTNPANANAQVLGVYDQKLVEPIAKVLQRLGLEEALVVHGIDGLDEISIVGPTKSGWLKEGNIIAKTILPRDIRLETAKISEISAYDTPGSARIMIDILNDIEKKDSPRRQMALANAAAAFLVGGKVDDLPSGVELGNEVIESGKAYEKVRQLIRYTNGDESKLDRIEATHDRLS